MQFRVPQNITMEDRIVGPLSPIQFGIVVIGGGIAFFIFQSLWIPGAIRNPLAGFLALFTVVLSVGKFNDQHMYTFIKFIVLFVTRPKIRIWRKEGEEVTLVKASKPKAEDREVIIKNISKAEIARLAVVLDSRGAVGPPPKVDIHKKKS